jgi:nucleotide-binding universal stress UspA family protein
MKNILVPADYSDNARNAAEYAIQLARATGASIEFLHVFPEPENVEEQEDIQQFKDLLKKEKTILTREAKKYKIWYKD